MSYQELQSTGGRIFHELGGRLYCERDVRLDLDSVVIIEKVSRYGDPDAVEQWVVWLASNQCHNFPCLEHPTLCDRWVRRLRHVEDRAERAGRTPRLCVSVQDERSLIDEDTRP